MKGILSLATLALLSMMSPYSLAKYWSVFSGYQQSEHQYLEDVSDQQGVILGASIDFHRWRRDTQGWLVRGPELDLKTGPDLLSLKGQLPLYQWHKYHGCWIGFHWQMQDMQSVLSDDHVFLGNDGQSTSLSEQSTISSTRQFQQIQLYWLETRKYKGALNLAGLYYSKENTPAQGEITNISASLFDAQFSGTGLMVGRKKDERGLNFQWYLYVASLDSDFSNDVTGHRDRSKQESQAYQIAFQFSWHYRYYLAPYWYLVPELEYSSSYLAQSQLEPIEIEHDSLNYNRLKTGISLRHYF